MFPQMGGAHLLGGARFNQVKKSLSLTVSNTTGYQPIFTVTGSVWVAGIWGVVTTVISSNHTKGHFRTNDQTAQIDVTESVTGITLSALAAGTTIYKESLTAVALKLLDNAAARFEEPASAGQGAMSPFILMKKTGAVTTVDYGYTTTNTPATGVILFGALWMPLSADGNLAAV